MERKFAAVTDYYYYYDDTTTAPPPAATTDYEYAPYDYYTDESLSRYGRAFSLLMIPIHIMQCIIGLLRTSYCQKSNFLYVSKPVKSSC